MILCSFSTSANLIKPSPWFPNPMPGEAATPAFFISSFENSREPIFRNCSGIFPQTNIVPFGFSMCHPALESPSTNLSLLDRYFSLIWPTHSGGPFNALIAAIWIGCYIT